MNDPWILFVEDNADDADMVLRTLAQSGRPELVCHCARGDVALDRLKSASTPPRLILLDERMPAMSGFDFFEAAKRLPLTRTVPIVMFSGSALPSEIQRALELGVNSYVCKPIEYDEFRQTVLFVARYWLDVHQAVDGSCATPSKN